MPPDSRFLTLADVAEVLNVSSTQVYSLVRTGELKAIKLGGRGQWRVETVQLEEFISRMYTATADFVTSHPFGKDDEPSFDPADDRASEPSALTPRAAGGAVTPADA